MKKQVVYTTIFLSALCSSAFAGNRQFYIGGMLEYDKSSIESTQKRKFGNVSGSVQPVETDSVKTNIGHTGGGGILFGFQPKSMKGFRFEASYSRVSGKDSTTASSDNNPQPVGYELEFDADYKIHQFELTGIKEFNIGSPVIKPFVLAGVGYYDADLGYKSVASSTSDPKSDKDYSSRKSSDSGFGFSLGFGTAFEITPDIAADLSYRYTDAGLSFDKKDFDDTSSSIDLTHSKLDAGATHRFGASVRYMF